LNLIFSFQPKILVFKSISKNISISSHLKLVCFCLHHDLEFQPKNDSNISHKSTSTQPQKPPPKGFHPPADHPVLPNISYCCLLLSSERIEYASFTSLNFVSASLSPQFLSG